MAQFHSKTFTFFTRSTPIEFFENITQNFICKNTLTTKLSTCVEYENWVLAIFKELAMPLLQRITTCHMPQAREVNTTP